MRSWRLILTGSSFALPSLGKQQGTVEPAIRQKRRAKARRAARSDPLRRGLVRPPDPSRLVVELQHQPALGNQLVAGGDRRRYEAE